jgi:hypothetical protein
MTSFSSIKQSVREIFVGSAKILISKLLVAFATITLVGTSFHHFALSNVYTVKTTSDVRNLIVSGVRNETEMTTASTEIKATVVVEKVATILGLQIGKTNLVYEGVGTVRSGFDLSKLEVKNLDATHHTVEILLPNPTIQDINWPIQI